MKSIKTICYNFVHLNSANHVLCIALCIIILSINVSGKVYADDSAIDFKYTFDDSNFTKTWSCSNGKSVEDFISSNSLFINNQDSSSAVTCSTPIPSINTLEGRLITIKAAVKGQEISEPPNSWNGIKVMLVLKMDDGSEKNLQLPLSDGSFQWIREEKRFRVDEGIQEATLVLGLEKSRGSVWFDEISISLEPTKGKRFATMFKGHELPRLRGMMLGPSFNENDIKILAEQWNVNQIRWQLSWTPPEKAKELAKDLELYDNWLEGALKSLDQALAMCEKYGIMVLVDLHTPPGGRFDNGSCRLFSNKRYQDKLVKVWRKLTKRYKKQKCIYAYELLNEPLEPLENDKRTIGWIELATRVVDAIREIDPGKPVVFEPGPRGRPDRFVQLVPLERDKIIYSFHMYMPNTFTHQGIHDRPTGFNYPGLVDGVMWNKDRLEEAMIAAIDFQKEFNVQIYIGEFSAIRWAPGNSAYRYLKDCIELFEKYGWDWSYCAFRVWHGWSLEHGSNKGDVMPSGQQTDRERLLRSWFNRNSVYGGGCNSTF